MTINSDAIYAALKSGKVDAQENPLALVDLFKIYEVVKYVSMTNHMWSGFNLLATAVWKPLPSDIKTIIERNVAKSVRLQRREQDMNTSVRASPSDAGSCSTKSMPPVPKTAVGLLHHMERAPWNAMLGAAASSK